MREKYTKYSADDPIKVLLVDDENEYRDAISRRLIKRGINPEHAACGEMCLEYLKNNRVDVIVMDVKMPGMSGIETLKKVKSLYPESEVILLTGQAAVSDGVEGIKSGAFDYLTKPVEMDHLLVKITQAYEKIKLQMEKEKEKKLRVRFERQMLDTERLVSLGRLSTGVAHEINNPLAIINEAAGLMQMILNKNEMRNIPQLKELKTANEKIENAVVRARKITHQLLGFAGKQVTEISETNLNLLIDECIKGYEKLDFNIPARLIRTFVWDLFASHYLEMVKPRAYNSDQEFS